MRYKKTEICQTCAKLKNACQTCILDLENGKYKLKIIISNNIKKKKRKFFMINTKFKYFVYIHIYYIYI